MAKKYSVVAVIEDLAKDSKGKVLSRSSRTYKILETTDSAQAMKAKNWILQSCTAMTVNASATIFEDDEGSEEN